MYVFEDISKKSNSQVWLHFLKDKEKGKAKCKICANILECKTSSTTSLKNHLRLKHKIILKSTRISETVQVESEDESETPAKKSKPSTSQGQPTVVNLMKNKQTKLDNFVGEKLTVGKVIGQLVSVTGLSFNQVAKSDIIREGFKHHPDGITIPRYEF